MVVTTELELFSLLLLVLMLFLLRKGQNPQKGMPIGI
jgi:hypothetical protein